MGILNELEGIIKIDKNLLIFALIPIGIYLINGVLK